MAALYERLVLRVNVTFALAGPAGSHIDPLGCGDFTQNYSDTAGVATCTATFIDSGGSFTGGATASVEKRRHSPGYLGRQCRGADANGWYNHPVPSTSTAATRPQDCLCNSTTYSGPDTAERDVLSGLCRQGGKRRSTGVPPFQVRRDAAVRERLRSPGALTPAIGTTTRSTSALPAATTSRGSHRAAAARSAEGLGEREVHGQCRNSA